MPTGPTKHITAQVPSEYAQGNLPLKLCFVCLCVCVFVCLCVYNRTPPHIQGTFFRRTAEHCLMGTHHAPAQICTLTHLHTQGEREKRHPTDTGQTAHAARYQGHCKAVHRHALHPRQCGHRRHRRGPLLACSPVCELACCLLGRASCFVWQVCLPYAHTRPRVFRKRSSTAARASPMRCMRSDCSPPLLFCPIDESLPHARARV